MKKLKVIVGLALVLMLGFSMAACTGDSAVNGSYSAMVGETEYVLVLAKNGEYSLSSVSATEKTLLNSGVFEVSGDKLTLQDNSGKQIVVPLTDSKPRFIFNGVELNFAKHATTLTTVAITFESNGGSTIKSISTVLSGSKILAPAPTKSGATFAGWYLDSALTQKFNAKTQAFLANATLYAKWEAAHVHTYGDWVITTPATCTTAGERTKTCACGEVITEVIPAGHTYGEWVVTTPATCTTAGERTRTCSVCKKVETEVIPAGHSYGEWVITPATCTTAGKKTKTCSVCGDKVEEIIPSTGEHAYGAWTITTPATCTTAGERTRTCSVCGSVETEVIHAGHSYGEWTIKTPATCSTAGEQTRTCSVCGSVETEAIPALEHGYGGWIETETGVTRECTVCHQTEVVPYTAGLQFADVDVGGTLVHMVTGLGTAATASTICIPKTHDGKPVGGIGSSVFAGEETPSATAPLPFVPALSLARVIIPSSVTSVGEFAFYSCLQLTDVMFAGVSKLTSIGMGAFAYCPMLADITISSSVTSIGMGAFLYCSSLTSFNIPNGVTTIGELSFANMLSLASITIPSSVTSIADDAFGGCPLLANIVVDPANANYLSIDGNLYNKAGTTLLLYAPGKTATSFSIPSGVTSIGYCAFIGCTLNSVTIPSSVTSIEGNIYGSSIYGVGAFYNCKNLTTVIFAAGSKLTSIGWGAFGGCTLLAAITIPSGVTRIEDMAFIGCTNLATVTFEAGSKLNHIGNNAFNDCTSLAAITIPSSVTSIGIEGSQNFLGAFNGCRNLATVTFEAGSKLNHIGNNAFSGCRALTSIIIPSGVTSIGERAFEGCKNLATIAFEAGSKLASIGNSAFSGCPSLATIIIPSSVTSIGNRAFDRCTSLASITIPSGVIRIEDWVFSGCRALTIYAEAAEKPTEWGNDWNSGNTVVWNCKTNEVAADGYIYTIQDGVRYGIKNGVAMVAKQTRTITTANIAASITYKGTTYAVTSIRWGAFEDCTALVSITIPSSVTSIDGGLYIDDGAFNHCKNLATVIFAADSKLASIGDGAFFGCTSLASVTIPSSVTSVGSGAFYGCTNLATVTFAAGSKLASIGSEAFVGCPSLASITVDPANTNYQSIGGNLYNKAGTTLLLYASGKTATSFTIPSSVTSIESVAFYGCKNLTSVTFAAGSQLTSVGDFAFKDCTSLASITLPSSVTSIGHRAFEGCTALAAITIPSSVTSIGNAAFYGCTNLATVTFAAGSLLTQIWDNAFLGCTALAAITIPSGVTSIGGDAFNGCTALAAITIPSGVTSIGGDAFNGCTALASITVDPANANYQSIEGSLYNKAGTELIQYAVGKTATSFSIPSSVTSIVPRAFYGCTSLASVTIPSGVNNIAWFAFNGCKNLTTVTFEAGSQLTRIEHQAFDGCTSLASITIPSSVTHIGISAFGGCSSLTSIIIPSSVISIGSYAFKGCTSLTSIIIPSSMISIGDGAFSDCPALTIYAEAAGKLPEWDRNWNYSNCPVVWNCSTSTNAVAEDGYIYTIQDGVRYGIKNGAAMVAEQPSTLTTANIAVSITYKGNIYPVTSMKRIGDNSNKGVFSGCTKLVTVTFAAGSKLTSIESWVFSGCTALTSIIIPSGVTSIEGHAFKGCTNLATVTFEAGSLLTRIWYNAFEGCTALTSIIIPSGVTSISGDAFEGCTNLATVTFEAGSKLTSIAHYAFQGCTSLAAITIPSGVTRIEYNAFRGCAALASITVDPANSYFQSIDGNLYNKAGTTLLQYAVGKTATSFNIPSSVTSIGLGAFGGCTLLAAITIPSGVTWIGDGAFSGCTNLATVTFAAGSKLTMIELSVFSGCTSLAAIIIPSSVTSIGNSAFSGCTKLTTVTFAAGSKLTRIEGGAFRNCTALTAITIPSSVTVIMGDSVGSLPVPVGQAEPNNPWGYAAFSGCTSLATVTFEAGSKLTSIGNWAFSGCTALTSIIIPSSVTRMDNYAFNGCTTLVVYVEAAEKPLGWHRDWSDGCGQVYWFSATAPAGTPATGNGFWHDVGGVPTKW